MPSGLDMVWIAFLVVRLVFVRLYWRIVQLEGEKINKQYGYK